ncbi:hypothetical protein [Marinoscillum furvescens]|uniref:Uncharacterized protein n=1 Tax=Marinoscillum furvescens DSM 4134 TaxID=1122208 RepID=A0A3D9L290_MARFU|nr:hypothetical protein [Marinoscillum furvescens]RED98339.1 hypothetical protein C7460_1109 [Marinoscillum furvescens DSM 4134]
MTLSNLSIQCAVILLCNSCITHQNQPVSESSTTGSPMFSTHHWVATDALGRTLPSYEDVGQKKEDKFVGVFYYIWHGYHGNKIYDITQILKQPESDRHWGPKGKFHFWGEPEYGYYRSDDPWVIRKDLQMLSNADVDFIFFDVTNNRTYLKTVKLLCEISTEMRQQGISTPEICFLSNTKSGRVMNELYDEFYSKGLHEDLWFRWDGKPLVLGHPEDTVLRPEVKDFFTIKYSWAWTKTKEEPNHWQWLDKYPQDYGWKEDPNVPEQITVSVAHHPGNPLGKSYQNGKQPLVNDDYNTDFTDMGLQFQEQWDRALEVDPQVVMVTQWNEWLAQRFDHRAGKTEFAGKPISEHVPMFVDVFTKEFNRDIAPMKGGYTDNYYYQLISNIRRYKGITPPPNEYSNAPIKIDGQFSDWADVLPVYQDPVNDITHRDHAGYDPSLRLTNTTGRNDIIESRVSYDEQALYAYAKTSNVLTSSKDPNWMLLFLDTDKNKSTGWEGYDFLINQSVDENTSSIQKWTENGWSTIGETKLSYSGSELELSIPLAKLELEAKPSFYFHWSDNPQQLTDIDAFFLDGDSAPDRRFDFDY